MTNPKQHNRTKRTMLAAFQRGLSFFRNLQNIIGTRSHGFDLGDAGGGIGTAAGTGTGDQPGVGDGDPISTISTNSTRIDQTPAGTSMVYGTLGGAVDGANKTYTTSQGSFISATVKVWRNGVLQSQGSDQSWQETTPASGIFDFITAPLIGDTIVCEYEY